MARAANQKLKILYILKLLEKSDEAHVVTMKDILGELASHEIRAERKRIYDDLDALRRFGYPIAAKRGRMAGYYLEGKNREGLLGGISESCPDSSLEPAKVEAEAVPDIVRRETKDSKVVAGDGTGQSMAAKWEWLDSGDTKVELICEEETARVILKELGRNAPVRVKAGKKGGSMVLKMKVKPGGEFYGWLAGFGCRVRLHDSLTMIKEYRRYLKEIRNMYKDE